MEADNINNTHGLKELNVLEMERDDAELNRSNEVVSHGRRDSLLLPQRSGTKPDRRGEQQNRENTETNNSSPLSGHTSHESRSNTSRALEHGVGVAQNSRSEAQNFMINGAAESGEEVETGSAVNVGDRGQPELEVPEHHAQDSRSEGHQNFVGNGDAESSEEDEDGGVTNVEEPGVDVPDVLNHVELVPVAMDVDDNHVNQQIVERANRGNDEDHVDEAQNNVINPILDDLENPPLIHQNQLADNDNNDVPPDEGLNGIVADIAPLNEALPNRGPGEAVQIRRRAIIIVDGNNIYPNNNVIIEVVRRDAERQERELNRRERYRRYQPGDFIDEGDIRITYGKHVGSGLYLTIDNHSFYRQPGAAGLLQCSSLRKGCPSSILITARNQYIFGENHNHDPPPGLHRIADMKDFIKDLARETNLSPSRIIDFAFSYYRDLQTRKLFTKTSAMTMVQRTLDEYRPNMRETFDEVVNQLQNYRYCTGFYRGIIQLNDDFALIFTTGRAIDALNAGTQLHVSGTINVGVQNERFPTIQYLLTVAVQTHNEAVPVVYVLISNHQQQFYVELFQRVKGFAPQLQESVQSFTVPYDDLLVDAIGSEFPNAFIFPNVYYFNEMVIKKFVGSGLPGAAEHLVWQCASLPYLPRDAFPLAIDMICDAVDNVHENEANAQRFGLFVRRELRGHENVICECTNVTARNMVVEALNKNLQCRYKTFTGNLFQIVEQLCYDAQENIILPGNGENRPLRGLPAKERDLRQIQRFIQESVPLNRDNMVQCMTTIINDNKQNELYHTFNYINRVDLRDEDLNITVP